MPDQCAEVRVDTTTQYAQHIATFQTPPSCASVTTTSCHVTQRVGNPTDFIGATLFQWENPKTWVMVFNVAVLFLPRGASWQRG